MALVTMTAMLQEARKEKRAIGAFNVANYETALAVLKAAEAEHSPVIIQVYDRLFQSDKAADIAGTLIRLALRSMCACAGERSIHLERASDRYLFPSRRRSGVGRVRGRLNIL